LLAPAQRPKQVIEATPVGKKTFLETSRGEPVSSNCFGDWFRDRRDEAGLRQCMVHPPGVRRRLSRPEKGTMILQCLAVLGWVTAVAKSRQAYQALKSLATHKTDRNDARGLTHLARTGFFKPVHVKSLQAQRSAH
jgi:hypothetical protein